MFIGEEPSDGAEVVQKPPKTEVRRLRQTLNELSLPRVSRLLLEGLAKTQSNLFAREFKLRRRSYIPSGRNSRF